MTPEQYVHDRARRSGSSFYYAFMFLAPARRDAMTAFYAFCREIDDVVDEVHDPGVAGAKVAMNYLGVPALVWEQLSGSDWGIYAATYSSGWAAPVLMQSSTAVSSSAPDVYVSSNSQIVVAWSQADSAGLRHIYGQRYK